MTFLIGVLGGVLVLVLFTGGGVLGWFLRGSLTASQVPVPRAPLTEVEQERQEIERRETEARQKAFERMGNYSVEQAYGMIEKRGDD